MILERSFGARALTAMAGRVSQNNTTVGAEVGASCLLLFCLMIAMICIMAPSENK